MFVRTVSSPADLARRGDDPSQRSGGPRLRRRVVGNDGRAWSFRHEQTTPRSMGEKQMITRRQKSALATIQIIWPLAAVLVLLSLPISVRTTLVIGCDYLNWPAYRRLYQDCGGSNINELIVDMVMFVFMGVTIGRGVYGIATYESAAAPNSYTPSDQIKAACLLILTIDAIILIYFSRLTKLLPPVNFDCPTAGLLQPGSFARLLGCVAFAAVTRGLVILRTPRKG